MAETEEINAEVAAAIKDEVKRFEGHRGYSDLRKELAIAFQECSTTPKIAHAIGARLMKTCKFCPVPAQVHEAFQFLSATATLMPQFKEPERAPDEKPFWESVFEVWTEADVQRHETLLNSSMKSAREYATKMLKGYAAYRAEVKV